MLRIATNGCFDLLHSAHKKLLERVVYLSQGGYVLILVDTDDRVKELKGPGRPIYNLKTRIDLIYQTVRLGPTPRPWSIDITPFASKEELSTKLDEFKPDMVVKGSDYPDISKIIGYGKYPVLIVPRGKDDDGNDISTTSILEGIAFDI